MLLLCVLRASWLPTGCFLATSWVLPECLLGRECFLGTFWVPRGCLLGVSWVPTDCCLSNFWLLPGCLVGASLMLIGRLPGAVWCLVGAPCVWSMPRPVSSLPSTWSFRSKGCTDAIYLRSDRHLPHGAAITASSVWDTCRNSQNQSEWRMRGLCEVIHLNRNSSLFDLGDFLDMVRHVRNISI